MPERRRKFTPGLKDEAVKMVIETSRPITEIARDIHVNEGTRGELGEQVPGRARRRRAGIERLRAGSAARTRTRSPRVADEDGVLGKSGGLLRPGVSVSSKYEFIDAEKALYPIVKMCEWMAVSTSGFYEWRGRPSSATTARRAELSLLIGKVFADSDDTYGYRRVHAELARLGVPVGPELVRTLMWELDLRSYDQPRVALGQTSVNIGAARRSRSRGVTSGTVPSIRAVATCATHDRTRTNGQRTGTLTLQRSHPCGAPDRAAFEPANQRRVRQIAICRGSRRLRRTGSDLSVRLWAAGNGHPEVREPRSLQHLAQPRTVPRAPPKVAVRHR